MKSSKDIYSTICRVCLSLGSSNRMVSLLDSSSNDGLSCYGKASVIFASISIKKDSLPSYMCNKCLLQLQQAITFKRQCEKSDLQLKKLVKHCGDSEEKIRDTVTEFVTFKWNFPEFSDNNSNNKISSKNESVSKEKNPSIISKPDLLFVSEPNASVLDTNNVDSFCDDSLFHDEQTVYDDREEPEEKHTNAVKEEDLDTILDSMEKAVSMDARRINKYKANYLVKLKQSKMESELNKKIKFKKLHRNLNKVGDLIRQKIMKKKTKPKVERNIPCEICKKVLANANTFKCHMQYHTGCQFICEVCGKGFSAKALLESHQAGIHGIGRFYICKECNYKAPRRHELVIHERTHTGERPYACEKCGLTFRRRLVWKKHAKYHMEKTVQCPLCPHKFHEKGHLLAHYNSIHERMRVYQCHECQITYAKPSTVRKHLVEKHGIPREQQGRIIRIDLKQSSVPTETIENREAV